MALLELIASAVADILSAMKNGAASLIVAASVCFLLAGPLSADRLNCSLTGYRIVSGLTAVVTDDNLILTWAGATDQQLRLRLAIEKGTPTIQDLSIRRRNGPWSELLAGAVPEFRVISGLRRITNQQLDPLAGLGIPITQEILDRYKWEAFWDAPLNIPGGEAAHNDTTPPQRGVLNQPVLPRSPDEIKRAAAIYHADSCAVRTDGVRLEVRFPGVQLGVFAGHLQFTVYRGSNLIRMEIIGVTHEPSVAYKYDAGIRGAAIRPESRVLWRDLSDGRQEYRFGGPVNEDPVTVTSNHRILVAESPNGAIAAFPPPHNFFWARETSANLGYNWYRKDSDTSFSFGVRQAGREISAAGGEDLRQNFALRSARPGTDQLMPVYLYPILGTGPDAERAALAFTRNDHFQAMPGFQVMATHFHMGLTAKAQRAGGMDAKVPDLEVLRQAGVNIVAPIDNPASAYGEDGGVDDPRWFQWSRALGAPADWVLDAALAFTGVSRASLKPPDGPGRGAPPTDQMDGIRGATARRSRGGSDPYRGQANYYETARRQSDRNFVVMPNSELLRGAIARSLGGHSDLLISHPVYWTQGRAPSQPLVELNPTYGHVYHLGSVADMLEMTHRENLLIYMPHPESKGSTGFPTAIKDTAAFEDANYRGIGFRWGMGLDGSERRLCEYRCLPLWDNMNNWVADKPTPPKYIQAISELETESYGDDIYANNPVNYVKLDHLPPPGEWGPIINAMKNGQYFVTSGEVLISDYSVQSSGSEEVVSAQVQWTFPLEMVEVVWGDGQHTGRQEISTANLPPFGSHRFRIPFQTAGKKWVRFAAWDSAGDGAMEQPVKLRSSRGDTAH